jgi:hypothetical protein
MSALFLTAACLCLYKPSQVLIAIVSQEVCLARVFHSQDILESEHQSVDIEALKEFPFIDVTGLKAELPAYLSASEDIDVALTFPSGGKTTKMTYLPGQRRVS